MSIKEILKDAEETKTITTTPAYDPVTNSYLSITVPEGNERGFRVSDIKKLALKT